MSQAGLLTYSRFMSFPFRPTKQWMQHVMKRIKEFTAAGLSGTLTPFPFHPVGRLANRAPEQRQRYTFSFFRASVLAVFILKFPDFTIRKTIKKLIIIRLLIQFTKTKRPKVSQNKKHVCNRIKSGLRKGQALCHKPKENLSPNSKLKFNGFSL